MLSDSTSTASRLPRTQHLRSHFYLLLFYLILENHYDSYRAILVINYVVDRHKLATIITLWRKHLEVHSSSVVWTQAPDLTRTNSPTPSSQKVCPRIYMNLVGDLFWTKNCLVKGEGFACLLWGFSFFPAHHDTAFWLRRKVALNRAITPRSIVFVRLCLTEPITLFDCFSFRVYASVQLANEPRKEDSSDSFPVTVFRSQCLVVR